MADVKRARRALGAAALALGTTAAGLGGALVVSQTAAGGNTLPRYVTAAHGNDSSATCTHTHMCKTLGRALHVALNFDYIYLEPGTYKAATDPAGTSNTVTPTLISVTIESDPAATGTATNTVITATGVANGLVVEANTVTVENLTFENAANAGVVVQPPGDALTYFAPLTGVIKAPTTPTSVSGDQIMTNTIVTNDMCAATPTFGAANATGICFTPTAFGDHGEGMHLISVASSTISGNTVQHNFGGILVTDELGPTKKDVIATNTSSTNAGDCGITLAGHNVGAVGNPVFETPPVPATFTKPQPTVGGVYTITVKTNTVNNNGAAGILDAGGPPGTAVYHNTVTTNTADGNGLSGFTLHSHAPFQDMNTNTVTGNHFANDAIHGGPNGGPGDIEGPPPSADMMQSAGIQILAAGAPVKGTVIATNTISDVYYGIWLSPGAAPVPHVLTTLVTNTITVTAGGTAVFVEPAPGGGYWMVGSDGGVYSFGDLPFYGSLPGLGVHVNDIVAMASTNDGGGYWLVGSNGGVYAFGDATYMGSLPGLGVNVSNITGIAATSTGGGYRLVGSDGGIFDFGDATYDTSVPGAGVHVDNVVGLASTPWTTLTQKGQTTADGYWAVASDGGIYSFGAAADQGSLPKLGVAVNNVVGMVPTPFTGRNPGTHGYWVAGADGGVFGFGSATYMGSLPSLGVNVSNITGITTNP